MNVKSCVFNPIVFGLLSLLVRDSIEARESLPSQAVRQDTFTVDLLLESVNGTPQLIVLTLGAQEGATNAYDNGFDQFVPPPSPSANFEAYFPYDHPDLNKLMRDIRSSLEVRHVWMIITNGSEGTMTWYPHTFPRDATFYLDGLFNMRNVTSTNFAGEDTMVITFNKAGATPDIKIDMVTYSFGDVPVGTSRSWTFTVFNAGDGDLLISRITFDQLAFGLVRPLFPTYVLPSGSLNVTISYTPSALGPKAGNVFIYSNDPDASTIFIALLGTGVSPELFITATSHDFGQVPVGEVGEWEFMVLNRGTLDLRVDTMYTDNPRFTASPGSFSVSPGDTQTVTVHFYAANTGAVFSTLTMHSNDLDESTVNVVLSGTGVSTEIEVSATSHDFGAVAISDSGFWVLEVSNIGILDLIVDSVTASPAVFSVDPRAFRLTSGLSQGVTVIFAPVSIGPVNGQLQIMSNDLDEPLLTVYLSGEGLRETRPDIYLEESGYDFGRVEVGQSALWSLNVINLGSQYLTIGHIGFEHPAFTAEPNSFTVSPSNLQEVRVTFAPAAVESVSSLMTITSNDPDEHTVDLVVTGVGVPNTDVEGIFDSSSPEDFYLYQNVPNPFNVATDIKYRIADGSPPTCATLMIYNLMGQSVRTLVDDVQGAGVYTVTWDGRDDTGYSVGTGMYCYRLRAGRYVDSKLMLLLR